MAVFRVVTSLLALLAFASGQTTDLYTFEEVKATLEKGLSVVLNVDGSLCESGLPFPEGEHRFVTLPFRDWAYVNDGDGNVYIRGNDYFAGIDNPQDFALGIVGRQAVIRPDGSVSFNYRVSVPTTGEVQNYDFECALGRSARIFPFEPSAVIDTFFNYREVKSALLLGKHIEATMFAEACDETGNWASGGRQVHYGHRIENFAVFNDATPDEFLVFYHSNLYANSTDLTAESSMSWGALGYILYPNGSVVVEVGIFTPPSWVNEWTNPHAVCETGVSMQFTSYREQDGTYVTYEEVKEATLKGHEMELILFTEFCDVISGNPIPRAIVGHRFDQFQLFEAGDLWGADEHITFSAFTINPFGNAVLDEIRLYKSGRVVFDWYRWQPEVGNDLSGEISCPLQSSALFHAVSRDRGPSFNYLMIMRAIKNEGAIFELEIRYDGCTRSGQPVNLQSIYGGVLWETLIRENAEGIDYYFVGETFTARSNNLNDNGLSLWSVGTMLITPDNRVEIYPRTYDWAGTDVTPFPSDDPIVCKLNTGGLDGSVYFFRYP